MRVRTAKVRALLLLPALAAVSVGLSGCDSKAGAAAVVNGHTISETALNKYLTPNAKPIPASGGSGSTPARQFVLVALLRNKVFSRMLDVTGGQPSTSDLTKAQTTVLAGTTESALTQNVTQSGLSASFAQQYLQELSLLTILQGRLTTQAQITDALSKAHLNVSVNPRYGQWDSTALSVTALSKKQLPDFLTIDGALPGDSGAASASSAPASP